MAEDKSRDHNEQDKEQEAKDAVGSDMVTHEDLVESLKQGHGSVESKDEHGNRVFAVAPSEEGFQQPSPIDNMPEPDAVGQLEYLVGPDPHEERDRQQQENYPRLPREYFDPHGEDKQELRPLNKYGRTSQSSYGRLVLVEQDVLYDGEVYKAGMQQLPAEEAEALIDAGLAYEPAGKGTGR